MNRKRPHIIPRLICLIQALAILNLSVDAPDGRPKDVLHSQEDLSINDMESIGEIVLELGFDIDDAIPEHDDSDETSTSLKKTQYFIYSSFTYLPRKSTSLAVGSTLLLPPVYVAYPREINPPPPKG